MLTQWDTGVESEIVGTNFTHFSYNHQRLNWTCLPFLGTDSGDSDAGAKGGQVINDVANYKNIFRPRNRELNRTPPPPDEPQPLSFNEPFQAPLSGSESEQNLAR